MKDRLERTRSSMLWAAWADALGFISELTSAENLVRRTKGRDLLQPMPWSRIIGGRQGVRVKLPEGCYSDDTQLRLATSRAINSHGFDVEAFARVELTVWPNYALGGGRGTRAAASAMTRQHANWSTNFFDGWTNAGGNGAAMRIHPHVFASPSLGTYEHLDDVVRNSIVTHGHPRGIVGAVFHAVALDFSLDRGVCPAPQDFPYLLRVTQNAVDVFRRIPELDTYWRPQWEITAGASFEAAWADTIDELSEAIKAGRSALVEMQAAGGDLRRAMDAYSLLVRQLGLDQDHSRGSGTLTAVAALLLAAAFPEHPVQSAQIAASHLNTDTDTIGTMAAALVGAATALKPKSAVLDSEYLVSEADRLCAISRSETVESFPYPDLLQWQPPRSAVDASGLVEGRLALAGISCVEPLASPIGGKDSLWVWTRTEFGQSILLKHRFDPRELSVGNRPAIGRTSNRIAAPSRATKQSLPSASTQSQLPLFDDLALQSSIAPVDEVLNWLSTSDYRDEDLGAALRIVAQNNTADEFHRFAREIRRVLARRG